MLTASLKRGVSVVIKTRRNKEVPASQGKGRGKGFHRSQFRTARRCRLSAGHNLESRGRTIIDHHGLETARHEGVNILWKVPVLGQNKEHTASSVGALDWAAWGSLTSETLISTSSSDSTWALDLWEQHLNKTGIRCKERQIERNNYRSLGYLLGHRSRCTN